MTFSQEILLYGSLFLAVLFLFDALQAYFGRGSITRAANRRLRLLAKGRGSRRVAEKLLRRQIDDPRGEHRPGPVGRLQRLALQAGVSVGVRALLTAMASATVIVGLALDELLMLQSVPAWLLAAALCVGVPLAGLALKRRARFRRFDEQLPDALDMLVRSLRAGHPVTAAMRLVANQMPDPMGTELGLAVDEMTFGLELREALQHLAERIDSEHLRFMVVAIRIQHRSGGNLAEVLGSLARLIRDRRRMVKKIQALSAEGRASAWVLSALPFVVTGAIVLMRPTYFSEVADDPFFPIGLMIAGGLLATGIFVVFRLVNFRF